MRRLSSCSTCQKTFKNSASLASHKYRFHKSADEISSETDTNKAQFKVKNVIKKRYLTDEMPEDSEVEHKRGNKRIRSLEEILSSNKPFHDQTAEYINNLRRENQKLSEETRKRRTAREVEEKNTANKANSILKLGNDKRKECEERNTTSAIRDLEGRCAVHEIILEDLEKGYNGKIKEIKDALQYKEDILNDLPYTEFAVYHTVEIQDLFKENNYKAIQFKIDKLQNAAKFASNLLTSLGKLTQEEQSLLDTLSDASIFEARSLLDQNYTILKSIFLELPTFDIYQDEIKKMKDGLNNKRDEEFSKTDGKTDNETDNETDEDELSDSEDETTMKHNSSSEADNEATIEDFPMSESENTIGSDDENTIGDSSSEVSDEDSSKTDNDTAEDEVFQSENEITLGDDSSELNEKESSETDNETAEDEVSHSENKTTIGDNSSELSDNESSKTDNETAEDENAHSEN